MENRFMITIQAT